MARRVFPSDRSALIYSTPGAAVLAPSPETRITVYLEQACTTKANITNEQGAVYTGSVLRVGSDYRIPEFLGPQDGTTVLWAKTTSGPAFRLTADHEARLQEIENGAAAVQGVPVFVGDETPVTSAPIFIWFTQDANDIWSYRVVRQDGEGLYPSNATWAGSTSYPDDPWD